MQQPQITKSDSHDPPSTQKTRPRSLDIFMDWYWSAYVNPQWKQTPFRNRELPGDCGEKRESIPSHFFVPLSWLAGESLLYVHTGAPFRILKRFCFRRAPRECQRKCEGGSPHCFEFCLRRTPDQLSFRLHRNRL